MLFQHSMPCRFALHSQKRDYRTITTLTGIDKRRRCFSQRTKRRQSAPDTVLFFAFPPALV